MFTGELHPFFDPAVVEAVIEMTPWWIGFLLVFLTHLGSVYVIVPVVTLAYWWDWKQFAPWIAAVIGYYAILAFIKSFNSATRPDVAPPVSADPFPAVFHGWYEHSTAIGTTSFPSGNVMAATIIAGLFVLDTRISTFRRRLTVAASVVFVVSYSRLALGVHYPVDVIGGIAIGLAFLAGATWLRTRAEDETLAMFAVAVPLVFVSLWVLNGPWEAPTFETISGSNRVPAFGAAVGGLVIWYAAHHQDRYAQLDRTPIPLVALLAILISAYLVHGAISHPLVTMAWAAVATAAIISLPWVVPGRETASQWSNWSETAKYENEPAN